MAPVSLLWLLLAAGLLALGVTGADGDGLLPAAAAALGLSVATAWWTLPPGLQLGLLLGLTGLEGEHPQPLKPLAEHQTLENMYQAPKLMKDCSTR